MSNIFYSMFGKDDGGGLTVAANVTTEEAKRSATEENLNGMMAPQVPGAADHLACMRNKEGEYKKGRIHEWLTANPTSCTGAEISSKATNKE